MATTAPQQTPTAGEWQRWLDEIEKLKRSGDLTGARIAYENALNRARAEGRDDFAAELVVAYDDALMPHDND